jgi:2-keto-4-pentenoate hydratase/2-oxohepta-3-ene-1,7-dioic acid hydratase in catechol pathway
MMTADEFGDPRHQRVRTTINGHTRQDAALSDMLFSVQEIIAYLSTGYSLRTGDVIVAGTPGTLPPHSGDTEGGIENQFGPIRYAGMVHMKPGDVVEVEISGLGVLKNTVVADLPRAYRPACVRSPSATR